jgi:hypothetical protein
MSEQGVETRQEAFGLLAQYDDVTSVYRAAAKVRDEGYTKWDVGCPFPIHNMDEAMGLKQSNVSWIMGFGAAAGVALALIMQYWTSAGETVQIGWLSGYKINVASKPLFAWEQFLPVTFELGVLISAFGAIFGMLMINRLPMWYHPLMKSERYLRVGDDKFFISIESKDPKFNDNATRQLLESTGAAHVEVVEA